MPAGEDATEDLRAIDDALIRLRRLWINPHVRPNLERDVGEGVELSHVLVVDAVARGSPREAGADAEVTVGVVADRVQVEPSTASRLVDATVRAGFVARRPSAVDSRRAVLSLTPAGRGLLERALRFRLGYLEELVGGWPAGDRAAFARLLARFADAVVDPGQPRLSGRRRCP